MTAAVIESGGDRGLDPVRPHASYVMPHTHASHVTAAMHPRNRNTVNHLIGLRPDACILVAHVSCHTCNPSTLYLKPCRLLDLRFRLVDLLAHVRLLDSRAKPKPKPKPCTHLTHQV